MTGTGAGATNPAPGHRSANQVSSGLDAVRQNAIVRALETLNAFDRYRVAAGAFDLRAHCSKEISQVDHFRFLRGVFNNRCALRKRGCHQNILGAGHRDRIKDDPATLQTVRTGFDITVAHVNLRTKRPQSVQV